MRHTSDDMTPQTIRNIKNMKLNSENTYQIETIYIQHENHTWNDKCMQWISPSPLSSADAATSILTCHQPYIQPWKLFQIFRADENENASAGKTGSHRWQRCILPLDHWCWCWCFLFGWQLVGQVILNPSHDMQNRSLGKWCNLHSQPPLTLEALRYGRLQGKQ